MINNLCYKITTNEGEIIEGTASKLSEEIEKTYSSNLVHAITDYHAYILHKAKITNKNFEFSYSFKFYSEGIIIINSDTNTIELKFSHLGWSSDNMDVFTFSIYLIRH